MKTENKTNKTNGCGKECRISQLTNEVLICGVSDMKGSLFYCDDCLKETKYKCPNCKRESTQEKKVLVLCGCGYEMKEVKINNYCNKCNRLIQELNPNEKEELRKEGSFVCSDCINKEMELVK